MKTEQPNIRPTKNVPGNQITKLYNCSGKHIDSDLTAFSHTWRQQVGTLNDILKYVPDY